MASRENRKFILGWLRFPPGRRTDFLDLATPYLAAFRSEPGCLFFELALSSDDADSLLVAECFADDAAHLGHQASQAYADLLEKLSQMAVEARFHNVYPGRVESDSVSFDGASQRGTSAQ